MLQIRLVIKLCNKRIVFVIACCFEKCVLCDLVFVTQIVRSFFLEKLFSISYLSFVIKSYIHTICALNRRENTREISFDILHATFIQS